MRARLASPLGSDADRRWYRGPQESDALLHDTATNSGFFSCSDFLLKVEHLPDEFPTANARLHDPLEMRFVAALIDTWPLTTRSVKPMTAARMLLKSWAIPPAHCPEGVHFLCLAELLFRPFRVPLFLS